MSNENIVKTIHDFADLEDFANQLLHLPYDVEGITFTLNLYYEDFRRILKDIRYKGIMIQPIDKTVSVNILGVYFVLVNKE